MIRYLPGAVRYVAEFTVAVNSVPLTTVVGSLTPPHLTVEVEMKFVPITVNVKFGSPTVPVLGEIDVIVGTTVFSTGPRTSSAEV